MKRIYIRPQVKMRNTCVKNYLLAVSNEQKVVEQSWDGQYSNERDNATDDGFIANDLW